MSKIDTAHVGIIISTYIKQSIANKATGLMRFGAYFAASALGEEGANLLMKYMPVLESLNIVENNKIDLDKLIKHLRQAMSDSGDRILAFPNVAGGIYFDNTDLDSLIQIANNYVE